MSVKSEGYLRNPATSQKGVMQNFAPNGGQGTTTGIDITWELQTVHPLLPPPDLQNQNPHSNKIPRSFVCTGRVRITNQGPGFQDNQQRLRLQLCSCSQPLLSGPIFSIGAQSHMEKLSTLTIQKIVRSQKTNEAQRINLPSYAVMKTPPSTLPASALILEGLSIHSYLMLFSPVFQLKKKLECLCSLQIHSSVSPASN